MSGNELRTPSPVVERCIQGATLHACTSGLATPSAQLTSFGASTLRDRACFGPTLRRAGPQSGDPGPALPLFFLACWRCWGVGVRSAELTQKGGNYNMYQRARRKQCTSSRVKKGGSSPFFQTNIRRGQDVCFSNDDATRQPSLNVCHFVTTDFPRNFGLVT